MEGIFLSEEKNVKPETQEVDITQKAERLVKLFLPLCLVLAVLIAGGVYLYQGSQKTLSIYDAQVESKMVNAKSRANGKVIELTVENGAHVEAGDVIAKVAVNITAEDLKQLQQTVELSQRNLEELKKGQTITVPVDTPASVSSGNSQGLAAAAARLQRMNELYEMGAISAVKRDEAEAEYEAAAAASSSYSAPQTSYRTTVQPTDPKIIAQAEQQLKEAQAALLAAQSDSQATEIVAPVAGTIFYEDLSVGSELKAGQTVARIGDAEEIWIEAKLTPEEAKLVRLGEYADYDLGGKKAAGVVQEIENESSQESAQNTEGIASETADDGKLTVRLSLDSKTLEGIRPGQKAIVKFSLD